MAILGALVAQESFGFRSRKASKPIQTYSKEDKKLVVDCRVLRHVVAPHDVQMASVSMFPPLKKDFSSKLRNQVRRWDGRDRHIDSTCANGTKTTTKTT